MMLMKEILFRLVMERVAEHQLLVFVHSRKDTARTAHELKDQAYAQDELGRFVKNSSSRKLLEKMAHRVSN